MLLRIIRSGLIGMPAAQASIPGVGLSDGKKVDDKKEDPHFLASTLLPDDTNQSSPYHIMPQEP